MPKIELRNLNKKNIWYRCYYDGGWVGKNNFSSTSEIVDTSGGAQKVEWLFWESDQAKDFLPQYKLQVEDGGTYVLHPKPAIELQNPSGKGIWYRCFYDGGWHGWKGSFDTQIVETRDTVYSVQWLFWHAGEPGTRWQIVRGATVRKEASLSSASIGELEVDTIVQEIALQGNRLHYRLVQGGGPEEGWMSINVGGRVMAVKHKDEWAPHGIFPAKVYGSYILDADSKPSESATVEVNGVNFYIEDPIPSVLASCKKSGTPFVDPDFPAGRSAICSTYDSSATENAKYAAFADSCVWQRPTPEEYLFGEKITVSDVSQGSAGDCWALSAIACVAESRPDDIRGLFNPQEITSAGCYSVCLEIEGRSLWLLLDDLLPKKSNGLPVFGHSSDSGELWLSLLEKAVAKWGGCYQNLRGGLQNVKTPIGSIKLQKSICGGNCSQMLYLKHGGGTTDWSQIKSFAEKDAIITTAQATGKEGLVAGHVFSVLDVIEVRLPEDPKLEDVFELAASGEHKQRVLHLENQSGRAVWFRHFPEQGGWRGNKMSSSTKTFDFALNGDNGLLKWMWDEGDTFQPIEELTVQNGDHVRFPDPSHAESATTKKTTSSSLRNSCAGQAMRNGEMLRLVKVRNPWGHGEWKGAWSDDSLLWSQFSGLKDEVGWAKEDDGIFFMQWEDYENHFGYIIVCGTDLW